MKAIAAMDENRAIGLNGELPWERSIKEDFKWFKEFTLGKVLVVGRKTFDKLPILKDRNIVVLSSTGWKRYEDECDPYNNRSICYKTYETICYIDKAQPNLICIGGAKTYELFLPYITEFYVTHVKGKYAADTFMMPFEHLFSSQEVVKEFDGHKVVRYSR